MPSHQLPDAPSWRNYPGERPDSAEALGLDQLVAAARVIGWAVAEAIATERPVAEILDAAIEAADLEGDHLVADGRRPYDVELEAIAAAIRALEGLDQAGRLRALDYLGARLIDAETPAPRPVIYPDPDRGDAP